LSRSPWRWWRAWASCRELADPHPAVTYIEIFRGTSLLVQLYWIFFVLPLFGITLDKFTAGFLSVGLNIGAYGAELVRGAIQSVPKGQWEAAYALSMSPAKRMRRIILPQALVDHAAALGQPADRAAEGHRARLAHLGRRPDVPDAADQRLDLPVGAGLRHGADRLLHPRPVHDHALHALARTRRGAEARARMRFDWNWAFTFEILPRLLSATVNTLLAAGIGYAIAVVLGLVFALAQRTPWRA
jgi:ABC-type amino acid transport system permease subunit